MTILTNSRSGWNFDDLLRDMIKRLTEVKQYEKKAFQESAEEILKRFLNSLPDGEIVSDGYFVKFIKK